jgi:hypothetical protein
MALNAKGGKFLVFDARAKDETTFEVKCHDGPRAQKNCWIDDNTIMTSGFGRGGTGREYAIWDMRNGTEPVHRGKLGNGNGVAHLYFNKAHGLLYEVGRGDMQLGVHQYHSTLPKGIEELQQLLNTSPTKGFSMLPKWALNPNMHEVNRAVHLTNDK